MNKFGLLTSPRCSATPQVAFAAKAGLGGENSTESPEGARELSTREERKRRASSTEGVGQCLLGTPSAAPASLRPSPVTTHVTRSQEP